MHPQKNCCLLASRNKNLRFPQCTQILSSARIGFLQCVHWTNNFEPHRRQNKSAPLSALVGEPSLTHAAQPMLANFGGDPLSGLPVGFCCKLILLSVTFAIISSKKI
jgi:hypothetical protein